MVDTTISDVDGDVIGVGVRGKYVTIAKTINNYYNVNPCSNSFIDQLKTLTSWIQNFAKNTQQDKELIRRENSDLNSIKEIEPLRNYLSEMEKPLGAPAPVFVKGTLCPAQLLYNGWWERKSEVKKQESIKWKGGDVQEWLFKGFEMWGPSWDVTRPTKETPNPYMIAQVGVGDEVDSLPVIIPPQMAADVRGDFLIGKGGKRLWAYEAGVSGVLVHRSHLYLPSLFSDRKLSQEDVTALQLWDQQWGDGFEYCILLSNAVKSDSVAPHQKKEIELYSGYIWKCVVPKEWFHEEEIPSIDKLFFLWEHTDFTKPDAVAYNMDSLEKKVEYIEKKYGNLVLLQKSSDLVSGDTAFTTDVFYNSIFEPFLKKRKVTPNG